MSTGSDETRRYQKASGSSRERDVSHPLPECSQRLSYVERALEEHQRGIDAIEERLARGEIVFAELRKDLERLTDEIHGIRAILTWLGGSIGAGLLGFLGTAVVWVIKHMP